MRNTVLGPAAMVVNTTKFLLSWSLHTTGSGKEINKLCIRLWQCVKKSMAKGWSVCDVTQFVKVSLVRWYLSRDQKQVREQAARVSEFSKMVLPVHALCRPLSLSVTYWFPSKEENMEDVKDAISEIRQKKRLWLLAWEPFSAYVSWEKQVARVFESPVEGAHRMMEKSATHHLSKLPHTMCHPPTSHPPSHLSLCSQLDCNLPRAPEPKAPAKSHNWLLTTNIN